MPVGLYRGVPKVIITNSGAYTASSATPNLNPSATGYGQPIPACEAVSLILSVTANSGTGGANNAWVELQHSPDGGTTWLCAARFTQVSTSATVHVLNLRTNGIGANEAAAQSSAVNTGTAAVTQNLVLSPDQRFVWTIATGQSLTFGVYAVIQPSGTRGAS
jgi:hypothetical protein